MTDPVNTPISGELMFKIRECALMQAMDIARVTQEAEVAKIVHDSSVLLHFLINGQPVETAPGYVTAPKPNTPEVLAGAGGPAVEAPKASGRKKASTTAPTSASAANSTSAVPVQASNPVQTAQAASGSAITGSQVSSQLSIVPSPTTLQATADSLKALVQDESRGGRAAAVALLTQFGVAQLNQIPAPKLAEFKAALDNAGKTAPAAVVAAGSDLL